MDGARALAVGLAFRSRPRHEFPRDPFVSQYASAPLELTKESVDPACSPRAARLRSVRWVARVLHLITCGYRRGFLN